MQSQNKNITISRSLALNREEMGAVIVTKGGRIGQILRLMEGQVVNIGRDASQCHLVLLDDRVSGVHCTVSYDHVKRVYTVTDMGSRNGTLVDKKYLLNKKEPTKLKAGSRLLLGCEDVEITLG